MTFSHVLISRPVSDSEALAAELRAAGQTPLQMPAFEFRATGVTVPADDAWRGAPARLCVFTSVRAVEFGLPAVEKGLFRDALVGAIGPATRAALEQRGVPVDLAPEEGFTSESFLDLAELRQRPGRALIFAAPGGRDALRRGLAERGWEVRMAPVYERVPLEPDPAVVDALLARQSLLSVWTSGAALEMLERLPEPAASHVLDSPMLVVSARLAEVARALGAKRVSCADGPRNADIVAAVRRLAGDNKA